MYTHENEGPKHGRNASHSAQCMTLVSGLDTPACFRASRLDVQKARAGQCTGWQQARLNSYRAEDRCIGTHSDSKKGLGSTPRIHDVASEAAHPRPRVRGPLKRAACMQPPKVQCMAHSVGTIMEHRTPLPRSNAHHATSTLRHLVKDRHAASVRNHATIRLALRLQRAASGRGTHQNWLDRQSLVSQPAENQSPC